MIENLAIGAHLLAERPKARENITILDIRAECEVELCRIEPSLHIPLNELPARVQELSKDVPLVVLCQHGMRSLQAVRWLRGRGYANAVNLDGGIKSWAHHVQPGMGMY